MDLIQSYSDEENSSSSDEIKIKQEYAAPNMDGDYEAEDVPSKVSGFDALGNVPIDRLMIAKATIAAQKSINQRKQLAPGFSVWCADIDKETRMYLGSIKVLQKHTILNSMDHFISKLTKDYEKIVKPNIADFFSNYIRTYMHIYKYLLRSHQLGKRYYKRVIKILAIYTDLELCSSIRGNEYDKTIAERLVLIYQTYLEHTNNSMILDVLLNTKRLWRRHRGILVLLFEYFLVRKTPVELPDTLFMKNLLMFKKWLYIEEVTEERTRIRNSFVKFVKPKKTICMNSLFKPYLPVDDEGFVTIDNINDILDKEYSTGTLLRCLKKSEERSSTSAKEQTGEVIILTDEEPEPEDDSLSNHGESSATSHDDISSDFDWYSASSMFGTHSSNSQNIIETVSIDSPPSLRKSTSHSSLDSSDWKMDASNSVPFDDKNSDQQNDQQSISIDDKTETKVNGDTNQNLSTLDESLFNRLVKDINSTHLSFPSNGSVSSDMEIKQNGDQSQTEDDEHINDHRIDTSNNTPDKVPADCDDNVNVIQEPIVHLVNNGEATESEVNDDDESNQRATKEITNHIDEPADSIENCDTEVNTILKGHEETLKNIQEILTDDLKERTKTPTDAGNKSEHKVEEPKKILVDTACSPLIFESEEEDQVEENVEERVEEHVEEIAEKGVEEVVEERVEERAEERVEECVEECVEERVEEVVEEVVEEQIGEPIEFIEPIEVSEAEEPIETVEMVEDTNFIEEVAQKDPLSWEPAAESTASVLTETSLLTKSQQEVLMKDEDAIELFSDVWSNGPTNEDASKPSEDTTSRMSMDSPLTFLVNGLDPNFILKTYSRKHRKAFIETKTISTQTIATQTMSPTDSACSSPVTTIDDSQKTNKEILNEKNDDDEQFLNDIFDSSDIRIRLGNSSRIHSPITYLSSSSTPKPLKTYAIRRIQPTLPPPQPPVIKSTTTETETEHFEEPVKVIETAAEKIVEKRLSEEKLEEDKVEEEKVSEEKEIEPAKPEETIPETIEIPDEPIIVFEEPVPVAVDKPIEEKLIEEMPIEVTPIDVTPIEEKPVEETPPVVVKRKRGRPRKYPLPTPTTDAQTPHTDVQSSVEQPKKERKPRGRKPKPKEPPPPQPIIERPRRRRTKRMSIFQEVFNNIQSPKAARRATRLISRVFGFADTPKVATILRRLNYGKSINTSKSFSNNTLSGSSLLYSFAYRLNGQQNKNASTSATNKETPVQTAEPKETITAATTTTTAATPTILPTPPITESTQPAQPTILERKTYLKPNTTINTSSSLLSSTSSPRFTSSIKPKPINHNPPARIRHFNRAQRYSRIDLITCHRRRNRKKSIRNTMPRVLVRRIDLNAFKNLNVSEITKVNNDKTIDADGVGNNDVQNSTPIEIDLTNDDEFLLQPNFPSASINSTHESSIDYAAMLAKKRRHFPSDDTDWTNEFTTDPESNVEDADDSSTRKSKRSRKRPKILDL